MKKNAGEFEQLILFALLRLNDNAYGVTIRAEIEARTGRSSSIGAVYTALNRLEDQGLINSRLGDQAPARGGRRRKYYHLEPAGARALQASYRALSNMADGVLTDLSRIAAAEPTSNS